MVDVRGIVDGNGGLEMLRGEAGDEPHLALCDHWRSRCLGVLVCLLGVIVFLRFLLASFVHGLEKPPVASCFAAVGESNVVRP